MAATVPRMIILRTIGITWMVWVLATATLFAAAAKDVSGAATRKPVGVVLHAGAEGGSPGSRALRLRGSDARQQVLATAKLSDGALRDVTRQVTYSVAPANVVKIDKTGL